MTTMIFQSPPNACSSEAQFRAWGQSIAAALTACGLERTTDTGQVDWSAPIASGTPYPYEVRQFTDALSGAYPVVVRIDYLCSPTWSATTVPRWTITVGRGSDGAGNITDQLMLSNTGYASASAGVLDGTPVDGYASSGDGSMIAIFPYANQDAFGSPPALVIDRSRAADGTPTGDGLLVVLGSTSQLYPDALAANYTGPTVWGINYATGDWFRGTPPVVAPDLFGNATGSFSAYLGDTGSLGSGAVFPVMPWPVLAPDIAPWQPLAIMSVHHGDYPGSQPFVAGVAGQSATYMSLPPTAAHNRMGHIGWKLYGYLGAAIAWW